MMKVLQMSGDVVVKNYRVLRDAPINIMIVTSGLAIRKKVRIGTGVFEKRPRWGESFFV